MNTKYILEAKKICDLTIRDFLVKDKTISAGQNIIKDTKNYQNKEWSEEKEKMNKIKNEVNKAKKKVLN